MKVISRPMEGMILIEPTVYKDERGFFLETYREERYRAEGINDHFLQDNQSRSMKGVLRGLHFQVKRPQTQMVTVLRGAIFDVGVDLRKNSPTYKKWFGSILSDESGARQLYMAPGFAHGFCVLTEWADIHYKVSRTYDHGDEGGLFWNDPEIGIEWPGTDFIITPRDAAYPLLKDMTDAQLPHVPPIEL